MARSFKSDREQIWEQLAAQLHGKFQDEEGWARDKVIAHVDPWRIVLDIHVYPGWRMQQQFTRLRAPFVNADGFRFHIYRNGPLGQLADLTGIDRATCDIKVGQSAFDRQFTICSNSSEKVRQLLANDRVRELMEQAGDMRLEIRADDGEFGPYFPPGVDELRLEVSERVDDLQKLRALYELLAEVLHGLHEIGCAADKDPNVEL